MTALLSLFTLINPKLKNDKPFDAIVSTPPYSIKWIGSDDPTLINDERFAPAGILAPKSKADVAFILHVLNYLSAKGRAAIVTFPGIYEQLWLTQSELAELYQTTKQNISKHIKTILAEGEIDKISTVNSKLTVQTEGNRTIRREVAYYALPLIIAVGYRVRSTRGTQLRL